MAYLKTLEVAFAKPMKNIKDHFAKELAKPANLPDSIAKKIDNFASDKNTKQLKSIIANDKLGKSVRDYAKRVLDELEHALSEHQRSMEEATSNLDKIYLLTGQNTKEGYEKAVNEIIRRVKPILKSVGLSKIKEVDEYDYHKKNVYYGITFTGWSLEQYKVTDFTKPLKEEFSSFKPQIQIRRWNAFKGYMYEVTMDFTIKTISETANAELVEETSAGRVTRQDKVDALKKQITKLVDLQKKTQEDISKLAFKRGTIKSGQSKASITKRIMIKKSDVRRIRDNIRVLKEKVKDLSAKIRAAGA